MKDIFVSYEETNRGLAVSKFIVYRDGDLTKPEHMSFIQAVRYMKNHHGLPLKEAAQRVMALRDFYRAMRETDPVERCSLSSSGICDMSCGGYAEYCEHIKKGEN